MTARRPDKSRTNRDGQRPDVTTIPRGRPTLPPLPSLQEPLYVIGAPPVWVREAELSDPLRLREGTAASRRLRRGDTSDNRDHGGSARTLPATVEEIFGDWDPREVANLRKFARTRENPRDAR